MRRPLIAVAVVFVLMLPLWSNNYIIRLTTIMMLYSVLSLSWNFIGGLTGYPSFATASFFGVGAYAGAISQVNGVPMYLSWTIGALVAGILAAVLGLAILHLRGHYFAIASLVVADVLREIVNSWTDLTGGGMGLNLPILRLHVDVEAKLFYYSMFLLSMITIIAASYVSNRRLGFGLRCIKQNENAADMIGINTTLYKTAALVLSAVFVGCAGAFYASWVNYIEPPDVFDILLTLKPIVMVLLGSAGTVIGPVAGAVVFLFFEEMVWRRFLFFHSGVLGLLVVGLVLFLPGGLFGLHFRRLFHWKGSR